jgi:hypothetical protein
MSLPCSDGYVHPSVRDRQFPCNQFGENLVFGLVPILLIVPVNLPSIHEQLVSPHSNHLSNLLVSQQALTQALNTFPIHL